MSKKKKIVLLIEIVYICIIISPFLMFYCIKKAHHNDAPKLSINALIILKPRGWNIRTLQVPFFSEFHHILIG